MVSSLCFCLPSGRCLVIVCLIYVVSFCLYSLTNIFCVFIREVRYGSINNTLLRSAGFSTVEKCILKTLVGLIFKYTRTLGGIASSPLAQVLLPWAWRELVTPKIGGPSHLRVLKSGAHAAPLWGSSAGSGSKSSLILCFDLDPQEYYVPIF